MKVEKPVIIELYELWNSIKSRFSIISPQPKSFNLKMDVQPITTMDSRSVEWIDLSDTTQVNAAANNTQTLQPPKGFLYEIRGMAAKFPDPVGSGAGSHTIFMNIAGSASIYGRLFSATSDFGSDISYAARYGWLATATYPSSGDSQRQLYQTTIVSNEYPLDFLYSNNTDVNQTGNREIYLLVLKTQEVIL